MIELKNTYTATEAETSLGHPPNALMHFLKASLQFPQYNVGKAYSPAFKI